MNKTGAAMILVLLAFVAAAATNGEKKIRADRTPLTFRDSGVYCNYRFGHARAEEGLTNMLPADRAASTDSPRTFYVMQYFAPLKPLPEQDTSLIRRMAQNGKKVVLRADIGRMHENPDVDLMEQRLVGSITWWRRGDTSQLATNRWSATKTASGSARPSCRMV